MEVERFSTVCYVSFRRLLRLISDGGTSVNAESNECKRRAEQPAGFISLFAKMDFCVNSFMILYEFVTISN